MKRRDERERVRMKAWSVRNEAIDYQTLINLTYGRSYSVLLFMNS